MEVRDKYKVNEDICYILPASSRRELSRPYGILFSSTDKLLEYITKFNRVISVGDVVTESLLLRKFTPFLSIVDRKTKRKSLMNISILNFFNKVLTVANEAATIRLSVMKILEEILQNTEVDKTLVIVDGEEDLLVIPVVMYGREGDIVVYGQPNAGPVALEINELTKWRVRDILSKFIIKKC